MTSIQKIWVALIAVAIIALGGWMYPAAKQAVQQDFRGVTNYDEVDTTAIKIGGSSGSRVGPIITGTCALILPGTNTATASTSISMDCAVTGVVSGDTVFASFATSTAITSTAGLGWSIAGASASTTSGFITLRINNNTGANNVPSPVGSTTQFLVLHPVTSVPGL